LSTVRGEWFSPDEEKKKRNKKEKLLTMLGCRKPRQLSERVARFPPRREHGRRFARPHKNRTRVLPLLTLVYVCPDSQARIAAIRSGLVECKTLLQCKRDNIRALWIENLENTEMLRLLDKMYALACGVREQR
jgi:hypothetical protein